MTTDSIEQLARMWAFDRVIAGQTSMDMVEATVHADVLAAWVMTGSVAVPVAPAPVDAPPAPVQDTTQADAVAAALAAGFATVTPA